jgi:hypothetical protein
LHGKRMDRLGPFSFEKLKKQCWCNRAFVHCWIVRFVRFVRVVRLRIVCLRATCRVFVECVRTCVCMILSYRWSPG